MLGIDITADTWFVAGLHDTTTDHVTVFDTHLVPVSHRKRIEQLQAWLGPRPWNPEGRRRHLPNFGRQHQIRPGRFHGDSVDSRFQTQGTGRPRQTQLKPPPVPRRGETNRLPEARFLAIHNELQIGRDLVRNPQEPGGPSRHGSHPVTAGEPGCADSWVMPFEKMEALSREVNALQHHVHKIMSREIVREHGVMMMLGSMRAEERLAAFLLNLTTRLHARGFSRSELVLRMTREEIGSYLGLKIETVSRTFSKLVDDGVLEVKQKNLRILKPDALREIVNAPAC